MNLYFSKIIILIFLLPGIKIFAQESFLAKFDFNSANIKQIELSQELYEISGMTNFNGNLICHTDENSDLFLINGNTGKIIKRFRNNKKKVRGDFEDITNYNGEIFLVESNGTIYKINLDVNFNISDFKKIKTPLKKKNDIEGIEFSPDYKNILLTCKEFPGKHYKGFRSIYSYNIKKRKLNNIPKYLIDIKKIKSLTGRKHFNPSSIIKTDKKTYLILDGKGKSIVEIDFDGKIISVVRLNKKLHQQPEGIEILNNCIIISDEGSKNKKATLTFYKQKK